MVRRTVADAGADPRGGAVTLLAAAVARVIKKGNAIRGTPHGRVIPAPNVGRGYQLPNTPDVGVTDDDAQFSPAYLSALMAQFLSEFRDVYLRKAEEADTFDSYRPQSVGGESLTQLNLTLDYALQEVQTLIVTGPTILAPGNNGTAFTLQLGGRSWQLLLPPVGILTMRFKPGILLKRADLNQLISATAGNWAVECTGNRSDM